MKNIRLLILTILSAVILASCHSDEPFRHVVFADSPRMFSTVSPVMKGSRSRSYITEGVSYYIVFDDENRKATLTINNLVVGDDEPAQIVTFKSVEWTYEPGAHEKRRIISAPVMYSDGDPGADVVLTDVTIIYTESNDMNVEQTAGFYASYTVNDMYRVFSYPYAVCADGTTTVHLTDDNSNTDILYDPVYIVRFDPVGMTASVSIYNLTINNKVYDLTVSDLSLTLDDDGYSFESTSRSSLTMGASDADVKLQDVRATAQLRARLNLHFRLVVDDTSYDVEGFLSPDLSTLKP